MSHFTLQDKVYHGYRNYDPYNTYMDDASFFLKKTSNIDLTKNEFKEMIDGSNFKDPTVKYYDRNNDTFDKEITEDSLNNYLGTIYGEDLVVLPSMSCYRKDIFSLDANWTEYNVDKRNGFKKKAKVYEQDGDMVNYAIFNNLQKTKKIKNNALSGTYSLTNSPLHTFSAHYALTSITKVTSGIGNALTERMIGGNRFYRLKDDPITDMITYIKGSDYKLVEAVVKNNNLHIPTVNEIMSMVHESSKWYWEDKEAMDIIHKFTCGLDSIERCIVMYSHDLYFMFKFNNGFISKLFKDMSTIVQSATDDVEVLKNGDYDIMNTLHMMNYDILKGVKVNYELYKGKTLGYRMVGMYMNIVDVLDTHQSYIDAFFRKVIAIPINAHYIREMIRRIIVLSDTDSTCGAIFRLIQKENERFALNDINIRRMAGVVLFLSGTTNHVLKIYAATTNADPAKYGRIQMKAEYIWSIFLPALVKKHYLTSEIIKEMFIRKEPDVDVSGVNLIASSLPVEYQDKFKEFRLKMIKTWEGGNLISLQELINEVIALEDHIEDVARTNPSKVLRFDKINIENAYKLPWNKSNYFHHTLWHDVFEDKYGAISDPPYRVLKLPVLLKGKARLNAFVADNPDTKIPLALKEAFIRAGKGDITLLRLPVDVLEEKGVPKELLSVIDTNSIINSIVAPFYTLLESVGIFKYKDMLIRDFYRE